MRARGGGADRHNRPGHQAEANGPAGAIPRAATDQNNKRPGSADPVRRPGHPAGARVVEVVLREVLPPVAVIPKDQVVAARGRAGDAPRDEGRERRGVPQIGLQECGIRKSRAKSDERFPGRREKGAFLLQGQTEEGTRDGPGGEVYTLQPFPGAPSDCSPPAWRSSRPC